MKISDNIGYLMNRTGLRMKLVLQKTFNENGYSLTAEHWGILQKLYERDNLTQVELATLLSKDKPNITRIIDVMEKNNLVQRKAAPNDRRKYLISPTAYAKNIKKDLFSIARTIKKRAYQGLSASDLARLRTQLNHIFANLE